MNSPTAAAQQAHAIQREQALYEFYRRARHAFGDPLIANEKMADYAKALDELADQQVQP